MQENYTKPFEWILNDRYRWWFHLLFWIVMYLDEVLSLIGITEPFDNNLNLFLPLLADMALVYFNLYVLLPALLLKNRAFLYFFLSLTILIINISISSYPFGEENVESYDWLSISLFASVFTSTATILGTAVCVKLFKQFIRSQQKVQELREKNLQTELAYLKEQINPHFLFNALNNLYVQSRKRPAEVPENILQLSELLRYQIYDSAKEKVLLKDEIEYLKNYLRLDSMRKSTAKINFDVEGTSNGIEISPFLFLPFVENAVKYGTDLDGNGNMNIRFDVKPNELIFQIDNPKPNQKMERIQGGIGLANVKRRLDLLYPNQYDLRIDDGDEKYEVKLRLNLKPSES